MVDTAWGGARDADMVALLIDAKKGITDAVEEILTKLADVKLPKILILNKIDITKREKLLELAEAANRIVSFDQTFMVSAQTAYISPPFGYTLFYLKGTLPPEIGMGTVYRGIIPFVLLQLVGLGLCAAFPELVLWLPKLMVAG